MLLWTFNLEYSAHDFWSWSWFSSSEGCQRKTCCLKRSGMFSMNSWLVSRSGKPRVTVDVKKLCFQPPLSLLWRENKSISLLNGFLQSGGRRASWCFGHSFLQVGANGDTQQAHNDARVYAAVEKSGAAMLPECFHSSLENAEKSITIQWVVKCTWVDFAERCEASKCSLVADLLGPIPDT